MFIEVKHEELIVGEKYKIKTSPNSVSYFTGILQEIFIENDRYIQSFDKVILYPNGNRKGVYIGYNKHLCLYYYAYVSQKEQIQQAMEKRALDKILKRLVNDDFTW